MSNLQFNKKYISDFIKSNKGYIFLSSIIFLLSIHLRFSKLTSVITFGHDNSRDMIMIYKMFKYGEIIYQGPVFSVVWGFISPLYFYLLAPFFYLTSFNPITAGVLMLVINVFSLILLMIILYKEAGKVASITGGLFYGLSLGSIVQYGQGLNPSLEPIAIILLIYSVLLIIKGKTSYLVLLSFTIASLLSFHPSGFFILVPLIILYFIYRPRFNIKIILISLSILGLFLLLPYAIQEKKFNLINTKKLIEYFANSESSDASFTLWQKLVNTFSVMTKDFSILISNEIYISLTLIGGLLLISIIWHSIKFYKIKNNTNTIAFISLTYLLSLGLSLSLDPNSPYDSWFFAVLMPMIIIFIGFWFQDIYKTKYKLLIPIVLLSFATINIYKFYTYVPSIDSYSFQKHLVNLIRYDSNGKDFDVYGSQREPIYYMMWYTEDNPTYKESYYGRFKWGKDKGSPLVYFIEREDRPLVKGEIDEINNLHRVNEWTMIDNLEKEFGVKIYRAVPSEE